MPAVPAQTPTIDGVAVSLRYTDVTKYWYQAVV
jgi:hypothetical protein